MMKNIHVHVTKEGMKEAVKSPVLTTRKLPNLYAFSSSYTVETRDGNQQGPAETTLARHLGADPVCSVNILILCILYEHEL